MRRILCRGCMVLAMATPALASGVLPDPAGGMRVEQVARKGSARSQFDHAGALKRKLRGREGAARLAARRAAVDAYRAVRRYFPRDRALGAEAAFRAGELLRSARFDDEALAEFEVARDLGRGTVFRPRGGLEVAHLHRRRARLLDALVSYQEVVAMEDADREYVDRARYWRGCVQAKLGRDVEARRSWEQVARRGTSALQRVSAFDAWAGSLIEAGDLEGAAGVLQLCRDELEPLGEQRTGLGLRVRSALERMRSVERLARAVAKRLEQRREAGLAPSSQQPMP